MPNLVVIEYTQSIAYEQDGAPQERLSISVRFTYEAVSSGWVREDFGGRGGPTTAERQALAVYRSRNVDPSGWYGRLHEMYRKIDPRATTDRTSLEGVLLHLEPFSRGEMAAFANARCAARAMTWPVTDRSPSRMGACPGA